MNGLIDKSLFVSSKCIPQSEFNVHPVALVETLLTGKLYMIRMLICTLVGSIRHCHLHNRHHHLFVTMSAHKTVISGWRLSFIQHSTKPTNISCLQTALTPTHFLLGILIISAPPFIALLNCLFILSCERILISDPFFHHYDLFTRVRP